MKAAIVLAAFGLGMIAGMLLTVVVADEVRGGAETAWYGR